MPNIDLITVPKYQSYQPYHYEYDNLPLESLMQIVSLINGAVDNITNVVSQAAGSAGDLNNRLNQSLKQNGDLKASAVDLAMHSIEGHIDTDDYVRMTSAERAKLNSVTNNAVNINIKVASLEFPSESTTLEISDSDSISWRWNDNKIYADTTFPTTAVHQHNYNLVPITINYQNYQVTSLSTPYIEGSLRVYINGTRLNPAQEIYVPGLTPNDAWTLISYTEDASNGLFVLSTTITSSDFISIDFDVAF